MTSPTAIPAAPARRSILGPLGRRPALPDARRVAAGRPGRAGDRLDAGATARRSEVRRHHAVRRSRGRRGRPSAAGARHRPRLHPTRRQAATHPCGNAGAGRLLRPLPQSALRRQHLDPTGASGGAEFTARLRDRRAVHPAGLPLHRGSGRGIPAGEIRRRIRALLRPRAAVSAASCRGSERHYAAPVSNGAGSFARSTARRRLGCRSRVRCCCGSGTAPRMQARCYHRRVSW